MSNPPPWQRLLVLGTCALACAPSLQAQTGLRLSDRDQPTIVEAERISGRPELETVAEGNATIERGTLRLRADRLSYDAVEDRARATGAVRIDRDGNVYTGPDLELKLQTFEGRFIKPTYHFDRTQAGGHAERVEFLGQQRAIAYEATYSSCRIEDEVDDEGRYVNPAWELRTRRLRMDFAANEGIAEGAVLRFYGVPILAAPVLSFPLTDARKSGWLPPTVAIDSNSGLQVSAPYYWNIAPNRDATIMPLLISRRGAGLETQYRYLEPAFSGSVNLDLLPSDRIANRDRYAIDLQHQADPLRTTQYSIRVLRVSDDDYWKDFSSNVPSLTSRLLLSDLRASRPVRLGPAGEWTTYARVQSWQVLQNVEPADRIDAPYDRLPQIGARTAQAIGPGLRVDFVTEFNRFTDPRDVTGGPAGVPTGLVAGPRTLTGARPTGNRVHAIGALSRPWITPGWSITPRVAFNAASYHLDAPLANGRSSDTRVIPTFSLDSAWVFERDSSWFGKALRQTLEPRLLYANTPYREQINLPVFDSALKDFNFDSIYTENEFSGVDRVSDSHQVTAGVTTRLLDPSTGGEAARFGIVQRLRLRDQRITADGQPSTQRWSDLLLLGRTTLVPEWTLESSVQYSPDSKRIARSLASVRWSPGPFRTLSATYRLARGLNEQVEIGWQWPLFGPDRMTGPQARQGIRAVAEGADGCSGTWYGVGRVNYSTNDRRITDSIVGMEYDSGCWIGRVVAERLSTGRSEATTRLMLQLELIGLSRLGSNPLETLKENIPGYRLLRETSRDSATLKSYD